MCCTEDELALGTDTSDAQILDPVFSFLVPWALSWWNFMLPHSLSPTLHQHWCGLSDSRSLYSYDSMFLDVYFIFISTSVVKIPWIEGKLGGKEFMKSHRSMLQSMSFQGSQGRNLKPLVTFPVKNSERHIHIFAQFTFSTLMQSGAQAQGKVLPKGDCLFPHSLVKSKQSLKCQLEADNFILWISSQINRGGVMLTTKANPQHIHITTQSKNSVNTIFWSTPHQRT